MNFGKVGRKNKRGDRPGGFEEMAETGGQSFQCGRVCLWDVEEYFGEKKEDKNGKRSVITGDPGAGAADDR